ncbi:HORMA-domain-containing protein [Saitoella complicata NRRL Y-17804]|uniref:HORMA domain-containing protein n=1 Tax=Saitoella complicata (strain BCRC 22490 / CBS 7301 / JCM 7358 / NBRC 10748 / NRRL Y-17804) TaxID=698492 RepID=A0A0E9NMH5_SAICN|nr:HORMA-domain-containing protein [Saitoella complicata NRRL Y-17804]ODQ53496.1 HORMA-domain-containing protein [Saitoella complicata NRRL Y-17804]GAO51044.1 hypothetical protein G7K_5156-t1 [Saitoella complicata NRRL Y-17804]
MSTAQLLRPQAQTTDQAQTTEQQSLTLLHTLITASFGCITYIRGIFPDDNFIEERFQASQNPAAGTRGLTHRDSTAGGGNGMRFKKLKRGYSEEANTLLDYIEKGVYDALEKRHLRSVILAIYLDPAKPHDIIESYTFSFAYKSTGEACMTIIDTNGQPIDGVKNLDARKSVQALLRRLIMLTQTLRPLPDSRWITIKLVYNERTPEEYQPPGFKDSTEEEGLKFTSGESGEEPMAFEAGTMCAGWHAVHLKVTSMADRSEAEALASESGAVSLTPSSTTGDGTKVWDVEEAMEDADAIVVVTNPMSNSQLSQRRAREDTQGSEEGLSSVKLGEAMGQKTAQNDGLRGPVVQERVALQRMLHPRQATVLEDSTQQLDEFSQVTQLIASSPATGRPPLRSITMQTGNQTVPQPAAGFSKPATAMNALSSALSSVNVPSHPPTNNNTVSKMKLTRQKTEELRTFAIHNEGRTTRSGRGSQDADDDKVSCECGDDNDDGEMVQCATCKTWCHVWCYGFSSGNDPKLPDDHTCYSCLLKKEERLLDTMRDLALFRRALMIVWTEGVSKTNRDFAQRLSVDLPTANQLTKRLQAERFIATNTSKSGKQNKSKDLARHSYASMTVVKTAANQKRMMAKYFEPTRDIAHHFEVEEQPLVLNDTVMEDAPAVPEPAPVPPKVQRPPTLVGGLDDGEEEVDVVRSAHATHREVDDMTDDESDDDLSAPASRQVATNNPAPTPMNDGFAVPGLPPSRMETVKQKKRGRDESMEATKEELKKRKTSIAVEGIYACAE